MVNNPLYPGYKPKKEGQEPINPIYPGYYVGGPMSKRPTPKNFLKPNEYKFDDFINQIDSVADEVLNTPVISPKWYKDRVVDDWKNQLKVSVSPGAINIDPTELDDYATDDIAGAQTDLSLNPKDWGVGNKKGVEQTKTQLKKTLTGWVKEATGVNLNNLFESNFSEIQNKTNQELWLAALGYREGKAEELQRRAGEAIAERTTEAFKDVQNSAYTDSSGKKLSPLDLKHRRYVDINGNIQVEEDRLYDKVANSVSSFERAVDSRSDRDKLHTTFLSNTFEAVQKELNDEFLSLTPKQKAAKEIFDAKVKTLKTIEDFQKDISGKNSLVTNLEREGVITRDSWRVSSNKNTNVSNILTEATKTGGVFDATNDKLNKILADISSSGVPPSEIDFLTGEIGKYKDHIKNLKDSAVRGGPQNIRNLVKELRGITPDKNFTTRSTFQDNLAGSLRKDIERSFLSRDELSIGSIINDPTLNLRATKIAPLIQRMRQDRIHYAAKEVLDSFERNGIAGIAENYVWKEIKNRLPANLERISSGGIVGDTLKRTNYFGLKIDDRGTPSDEYFISNPKIQAAFEKKYGNRTKVELDGRLKGLVGDSGTGKITVGWRDADSVKDRSDELKKHLATINPNPASLEIIGDTTLVKKFKFDKGTQDQVLFARLLNNDRSEDALEKLSLKMFGKSFNELDNTELGDIDKFFTKINYANNWVYQKSGGNIVAQGLQNSTVNFTDPNLLALVSAQSTLAPLSNKMTLTDGVHLSVLRNNLTDSILNNTSLNASQKEDLIKKLLKVNRSGMDENLINDNLASILFGKTTFGDLDIHEKYKIKALKAQFSQLSKYFGGKEQELKLNGVIYGLNNPTDTDELIYNLFKELRSQNIKGFGPVSVDQNDKTFLLIKNIFDKNNSLNDGYRLTQKKYLGRLEKINNKMQSLQKAFNKSFIGKKVMILATWQKMLAEKFAKKMIALLSKLIAKITGTAITALTGGLAALLPVLQALLEKIAQVAIKRAVALFKGIFKLDFTEFNKLIQEDLKKLTQLLACACGCLFSLFMPFLFILVLLASVLNPTDSTRSNSDGYTTLPTSGQPNASMFSCGTGSGSCNIGDCSKSYGQCGGPQDFSGGKAGFYYNQCDDRWDGITLGKGPPPGWVGDPETICSWGCLMTSIAMVSTYFGKTFDPIQINAMADGNADRFNYQEIGDPTIEGVQFAQDTNASPGGLVSFFRDHPNGEGIAILQFYGSDNNCYDQHWVVITGMCDGDFIMYDPYTGPDARLSDVYAGNTWGKVYYYWVDDYCAANDNVETSCPNGNDPDPRCEQMGGLTSSAVANRAKEIACDLRQGFGCLYNRPAFATMDPKYSHAGNVSTSPPQGFGSPLFNFEVWAQYGNGNWWESWLHDYYDYLFWCTWLPIKTYNSIFGITYGAAGLGDAGLMSLSADTMCDGTVGDNPQLSKVTTPEQGYIACFEWGDGDTRFDHVGIVYEINQDGVWVVESNGGNVMNYYPVSGGNYGPLKHFMKANRPYP